jgi:hypothetical protein
MNREARVYAQGPAPRLLHVIPRSCAYWGQACTTYDCYTQRVFYVGHSARSAVESKVAYKIFAPDDFARQLNSAAPETMYKCNAAKPKRVCRNAAIEDLPAGVTAPNGFILN